MDFVKNLTGGGNNNQSASDNTTTQNTNNQQQSTGSSGGGFMDKLNNLGGGGQKGEQNEDGLDKAVDFVQEKFVGAGDQSNESAAEQAKDEAISDFVRDKYKTATGQEFFIADKDKKFGA